MRAPSGHSGLTHRLYRRAAGEQDGGTRDLTTGHACVLRSSGLAASRRSDGEPRASAVLGPVRAWRGDEPLPTGSPQQRALLAALLLRDGRTATAAELIDALWGEEPPSPGAGRAAHVRLPAAQGARRPARWSASPAATRSAPSAADALDLDRGAGATPRRPRRPRRAGDRARARDLLNRGAGAVGRRAAGRPARARTRRPSAPGSRSGGSSSLETRLDLDLELGCHAEAVSELTALTAAHPLRERLRELLMLALYRSGRQAEALAVYADTRRLLADELGVDPRPELTELQQRILQADPELAAPRPRRPDRRRARRRPARPAPRDRRRTSPAAPPSSPSSATSSRTADGARSWPCPRWRASAASARRRSPCTSRTPARAALPGRPAVRRPAGRGRPRRRTGDGPRRVPARAGHGGLRDPGRPGRSGPRSTAPRLDGRRVLVLLDNARDAAQVRPLLPGTAGCAALVTSRVRMVDLAGAHLVDLDVMCPEEALQLFTRIVGEERVAAEREAALDVVAACGFLPLAIRIAASRLAARRTWTVSVLAAQARRRAPPPGRAPGRRPGRQGHLRTRLRPAGTGPGPRVPAAGAGGRPGHLPGRRGGRAGPGRCDATEDLLESLVDASLLESAAPGRYRFHDLVRLYARACAERDEQPPVEREAALSRLLDFYLATAAGVYALERPGDRLVDHLEPTRHPGLVLRRTGTPRWTGSTPRRHCLLACVRQSAGPGTLRRAVDLLWAAKDLAESGANSQRYETAALAVRDAARAGGDRRAEGRAQATLATCTTSRGASTRPTQEAERGHAARRQPTGDPLAGCWAPNDRGIIALYQSRHDDGEAYLTRAIDSFRRTATGPARRARCATCRASTWPPAAPTVPSHWPSKASTSTTAWATPCGCQRSLRPGHGAHAERPVTAATERLLEALDVFRDSRQRLWEGMTHFRLAEVDLAAGRSADAATTPSRR